MSQRGRSRPRVPKGFRDLVGDTIIRRQHMIDVVTRVYRSYGFQPLETPTVEFADALGKYLPEADLSEGGIFAFKDQDGQWLALRYDLTAPLSRFVALHEKELPLPFRRYQVGLVYRHEKPGPGRFREFYQCDFDTVGAHSLMADAEVCFVLCDALEALGIRRGQYVVKVNDRKLLTGVLEKAGIEAREGSARWLAVMRAIDKLDRLGMEGVAQLLGAGRKDESGDFTDGAHLEPAQIDAVFALLQAPRSSREVLLDAVERLVAGSQVGEEGVSELLEVHEYLEAAGYGDDRVVFDPTVVRGLSYYTGPVFEAELTVEDSRASESRAGQRFGAVAGGGRYDGLLQRFLGRRVPATGASIGVDRLVSALEQLGLPMDGFCGGQVLVATAGDVPKGQLMQIVSELREAGVPVEPYLGNKGIGGQFRYADRRGMRAVVVVGEEELRKGMVSVKDLEAGRRASYQVRNRDAWRKDRPAQVTVPRNELVPTLRRILEDTQAATTS